MTFTSAQAAREFILAGDALFTIKSLASGAHYTYRVQRAEQGQRWFVKVLAGPEDYQYIGVIDGSPLSFRTTGKSKHGVDSTAVKAFQFMLSWLVQGNAIHSALEIRHSGRCGRCARTLTHPASIDRGIGPECSEILAAS